MTERFVFPIRYDEALMRRAVTGFMTRTLIGEQAWKTFLPLGLILLSCIGLYVSGDAETGVELFIAASAILGVFVFAGWRMHWRIMREKMAAVRGRFVTARLSDEGIVIDGPGQATRLDWPAVKAIWRFDGVWLLIAATNHFIALPLAGAPPAALQFLEAQVRGAPAA
jgi:hypothetical protein